MLCNSLMCHGKIKCYPSLRHQRNSFCFVVDISFFCFVIDMSFFPILLCHKHIIFFLFDFHSKCLTPFWWGDSVFSPPISPGVWSQGLSPEHTHIPEYLLETHMPQRSLPHARRGVALRPGWPPLAFFTRSTVFTVKASIRLPSFLFLSPDFFFLW